MTTTTPSITATIQARWSDLSDRAQAHIAATRPALLTQWELVEEGHHYDTITADSAEEALEEARGNVDRANYPDAEGTIYIAVSARNVVTGEDADDTVTVEPDEPACVEGEDHDWQSPIELVGGIESNPGVFGSGGGVRIHEACLRCGCRRIVDTWAQNPANGVQGLTSVEYDEGHYDLDELGFIAEEREIDQDWRWTVLDRSDNTYTVADDEDDARAIAYRCRAGHATDYAWQDAE